MVIVVVTFSWTLPTNSPINPVVHQPSAATKRQVKVPFQLNPWEWTKLPAAIKQQWVCHCWLELLTGWVYLQISRLGILNFTTHSLFIWKLGFRAKVRLKGVCFKTPKVVAGPPKSIQRLCKWSKARKSGYLRNWRWIHQDLYNPTVVGRNPKFTSWGW